MTTTRGWSVRSPRRGITAALAGSLAAGAVLTACTEQVPEPAPSPSPEESSEPAPSGVSVAVVLVPPGGGPSLPADDVEGRLATLAAERVGDVASIRPVTVDDVDFVPDTAALLADGGTDVVCVLGGSGPRTVLDLADRFPATRFCAAGEPRDDLPANVDLFGIDHEALGHVLGVVAASLAGDRPLGVVTDDDGDERARRRTGLRAALASSALVLDAAIADVDAAAELADAVAQGDEPLAALVIDTSSTAVAELLAPAATSWIGPSDLTPDTAAAVQWSIQVDAIISAAVDRVVSPDEVDGPRVLGFAEEVFALRYEEGVPEAVRDAATVAADEIARGTRDARQSVRGPDPPDDE